MFDSGLVGCFSCGLFACVAFGYLIDVFVWFCDLSLLGFSVVCICVVLVGLADCVVFLSVYVIVMCVCVG